MLEAALMDNCDQTHAASFKRPEGQFSGLVTIVSHRQRWDAMPNLGGGHGFQENQSEHHQGGEREHRVLRNQSTHLEIKPFKMNQEQRSNRSDSTNSGETWAIKKG